MVCRKILMVTACEHGEKDGQSFVSYVDFITTNVLQYPNAKSSIDKIRDIGNTATHDATLVNLADAELQWKS